MGTKTSRCFHNYEKNNRKGCTPCISQFSKPFAIHTDASKVQLGAVISQDVRPIAFYSRKLNPFQSWYTTTERELLSIVETLKEFRSILYGQQLIIHTDHKNLVCKSLTSDRVMRWRLYIEEYSPELHYVKGEDNDVANALGGLPEEEAPDQTEQLSMDLCAKLFGSEHDSHSNPLTYDEIAKQQQNDKKMKAILALPDHLLQPQVFHWEEKQLKLWTFKGKI